MRKFGSFLPAALLVRFPSMEEVVIVDFLVGEDRVHQRSNAKDQVLNAEGPRREGNALELGEARDILSYLRSDLPAAFQLLNSITLHTSFALLFQALSILQHILQHWR